MLRYLVAFMGIFVIGCTLRDDGIFIGLDGRRLIATQQEVQQAQKALLDFDKGLKPANRLEGGVVIDGKVIGLKSLPNGATVARVRVENVLFGEVPLPQEIDIITPPLDQGGITFKKDGRYRIFTVLISGAYRTWDAAGTVELLK